MTVTIPPDLIQFGFGFAAGVAVTVLALWLIKEAIGS